MINSEPSTRSVSTRRVTIPRELIPYLNRIPTRDYLLYMEDKLGIQYRKSRIRYCAAKIIRIPGFDHFMGLIIVLNLVVMILEIDSVADTEVAPDSGSLAIWTSMFGWSVLAIFVIELLMRLLVFRCIFWKDVWNVFDFVVVVLDAVVSLVGLIASNSFPVSVLRIFRLTKLARVFKVLRVFSELRLLLAGLLSSISAILWGTLLLFFSMLVWALVAVLYIHPLNKNIDYGGCERCPRAYSSVLNATLTFWQQIVAGDSWGQVTIPLIEEYPGTLFFFVPLFLSVGMAVTNLILGVVVNVAQQAQDSLKEEDRAEKALLKLEQHTHLIDLCKHMDKDNSGSLTREEVYMAFEQEGEFRESILALEITPEEFDIVWSIMDTEHTGEVSYKELVSTLSTMKISDTQFMLAYIKFYMTQLTGMLTSKQRELDESPKMKVTAKKHIRAFEAKEESPLKYDREKAFKSEGAVAALRAQDGVQAKEKKNQLSDDMEMYLMRKKVLQVESPKRKPISPAPTSLDGFHNHGCGQTHVDVSQAISSASIHDEVQASFKQVCQDIAMLRLELKDILTDKDPKVGPQASNLSAMEWDIMKANSQPDLLVVPVKETVQSSSVCCKAFVPTERRASEKAAPSPSALVSHRTLQSISMPQRAPANLRNLS